MNRPVELSPPPLQGLHDAIAAAADPDELVRAAGAARRVAASSLDAEPSAAADTAARVTAALSRLSDAVSTRAVQLQAARMDLDLAAACWIAFGSQARSEQTLVTDQDNGLVFAAGSPGEAERLRPAWLAFGHSVNELLDRCGYALCDGRVMAGQPLCCLSTDEWCRRFEHWMAHGSGNDLFAARIYFDARVVAGEARLAQPLLDLLCSPAAAVPRFVKQMADIVLCNHVPLDWFGRVVTARRAGREMFDLKMSGTALFVDAARLWALAFRLRDVGTVPRLTAAAHRMGVPERELAVWVEGFLSLLRLRLRLQAGALGDVRAGERAWVDWDTLDAPARSELKRGLRAARVMQQRIELDYCR